MNPAPWKLTRPGNNFSLSPAEITARNDSRIKPLNNLLHYHAKTLGAVLPLLGGVVPSRGSARGENSPNNSRIEPLNRLERAIDQTRRAWKSSPGGEDLGEGGRFTIFGFMVRAGSFSPSFLRVHEEPH
jgi:hypothetical protein